MLFENEISKTPNNIIEGLNPQQKAAVETINGPVLIIAGAGSGKTRVITNRIANLIAHGVAPWNILALTFTNKAAGEMKKRISSLIGDNNAEKIWAGTFHSVFAKLLRYDAEVLGYDKNFTIYDTDDSLSLVRKVLEELNISGSSMSPQSVRSKISSNKNKLVTWQSLYENPRMQYDKMFAEIYKKYNEKLKINNAMDFDDLLWNYILLLKESNEILRKHQDRFKYILVDEYQDTNKAQYIAINMLAKHYQNICVVGDDAQSIYGWRGADIQNILDFKEDYPNAKVFKLEQNYRSTKTILEAADLVIKNNSKQLKKTLRTDNPQGDRIDVVECESDIEEAEYIISKIKNKINSGRSVKDFCVLYRTNAQSLEFEKACRKKNLPYVIVGGMSFYKRKEVKDTLSYLRLLVNSKDSEALLRIVNEPTRGLGQTSLNHLMDFASKNSIDLLSAFSRAEENTNLQKRAIVAATNFAGFINLFRNRLIEEDYCDVVSEFIVETGLINFYALMGTDEAKDRIRNIEQVINDVANFQADNPESTLDDYIQQISLISDIDDKELGAERIPLMTLHSAKGLEFKEVFIAGLERGLFPLFRSDQDPKEEEEERRLFYVGITRAEQRLNLTYSRKRMKFGSINIQAPSPFLREIDSSLLNITTPSGAKVQSKPKIAETSGSVFNPKKQHYFSDIPQKEYYSQIEQPAFKYRVGDLVRHNQFGVGKITGMSGEGSNRKATVNFSNIGKKLLLLQYAKLEIVKQAK